MDFSKLNSVAKEYGVGGGNSGFLTLEAGDNRIRVVSDYEALAKHWGGGKLLGTCYGKDKGCPTCNLPPKIDEKSGKEVSNKPQVKFLMHVIDRKDGTLKIAELGWTIVQAMKELSETEDYAFVGMPPYDMIIKKTVQGTGKNPSDTSYTVIAARQNTDLTDEEKAKVAELQPITDIVEKLKAKAGAPAGKSEAEKDYDGMDAVNPDENQFPSEETA